MQLYLIAVIIFICAFCQAASGQDDGSMSFMYQQRAQQALDIGDIDTALILAKEAMKGNARDPKPFHLQALCYARMGNSLVALQCFKAALGLNANNYECRDDMGVFLDKIGKYDEAKKTFIEVLHLKPDYAPSYYHLGVLLKERGDINTAIESMAKAVEIDPSMWQAQRDLGLLYAQKVAQGDPVDLNEAIARLITASQLAPGDAMVHFNLAALYANNGNLDDSEAEVRKAIGCDSRMSAGHFELARLRYLRGDPIIALYELRECAKGDPDYNTTQNYPSVNIFDRKLMTAKSCELNGLTEDALKAWQEVAAMKSEAVDQKHIQSLEKDLKHATKSSGSKSKEKFDPAKYDALVMNAVNDRESHNLTSAKLQLLQATKMNEKNFLGWQLLGLVLDAQGDLEGASADYRKAMALRPDYDGLYYNFAYLLERLKLPGDAGPMYQKFHDLAGKYPYDPKHIVSLQQQFMRDKAVAKQTKKRGY